jgi:hypothetical protein
MAPKKTSNLSPFFTGGRPPRHRVQPQFPAPRRALRSPAPRRSAPSRWDAAPRVPPLSHAALCRTPRCSALLQRAGSTVPAPPSRNPPSTHLITIRRRVRRRGRRRSTCAQSPDPWRVSCAAPTRTGLMLLLVHIISIIALPISDSTY